MTIERIVDKTKRMLGKNYRGDRELVPIYSDLVPIEGYLDVSLVVSNDKFTAEEIDLIEEVTCTYSWWVANHGYLLDEANHEIPALVVYGSAIGDVEAGALNFTGNVTNGFYTPVDKITQEGTENNTSNYMWVKAVINGESVITMVQRTANENEIEINGTTYEYYPGRIYPEDRRVVGDEVVYPIYLVSNLDYRYAPVPGEAGTDIGGAHSFSLEEKNNLEELEDICEMVAHEAGQWTNRSVTETLLEDCWPVIVKCACIAYLNRGAEGLGSQSELGQQNVFNDWVKVLHQQITNRRFVM